jgi:hypothetical protein
MSKKDTLYTCSTSKQEGKTMSNKKTATKRIHEKKARRFQSAQTEIGFKRLLTVSGCSKQTADELVKWYTI